MHMLVGYPPGALGGEPYGRKYVRLATKWHSGIAMMSYSNYIPRRVQILEVSFARRSQTAHRGGHSQHHLHPLLRCLKCYLVAGKITQRQLGVLVTSIQLLHTLLVPLPVYRNHSLLRADAVVCTASIRHREVFTLSLKSPAIGRTCSLQHDSQPAPVVLQLSGPRGPPMGKTRFGFTILA
jgi:hypothetical protein